MNGPRRRVWLMVPLAAAFFAVAAGAASPAAAPAKEDPSVMLAGDWFDDPHQIDFSRLPRVPAEHTVISDVSARRGVNQHNYLAYFDRRFWAMWSDGPGIEDRSGQVVKFATSQDGLEWSDPEMLSGFPPGSGPGSARYNTRSKEGWRYIARGFWIRGGELLALASLDEAGGFFGPGLALLAWRWDPHGRTWNPLGVIQRNAINNFPPKQLRTGEWMMSLRPHDYRSVGVGFLIGGVAAPEQWTRTSVPPSGLAAEEPVWWELPDGRLQALFRDNGGSGYLFRAFSTDDGRTWSQPEKTNFPDAQSKFHGLRLSDGRYVLISNSNASKRDPLTLAVSDDGVVFDRLFHLVGGTQDGVDYPMVIEQGGFLYIAHSGGRGERKRSVEVQRVRLTDLDRLVMADARKTTNFETLKP